MKKNTTTFAELVNYYQAKRKNSKSKNMTGVILDVCYAERDNATRKGDK